MLGMLGTLLGFYSEYLAWRRDAESERGRKSQRLGALSATGDGPDASLVRSLRVALRIAMGYFIAEPAEGLPDLMAKVIVGKPPSRDELGRMVGRLLALDKPLPEEVADLLYAVMNAAMGRGMGDPGDMKEMLMAAACAWGDSERQHYLRGMLDVLKQQNRARRQTDAIGGAAAPRQPEREVRESQAARQSAGSLHGGASEVFLDAH